MTRAAQRGWQRPHQERRAPAQRRIIAGDLRAKFLALAVDTPTMEAALDALERTRRAGPLPDVLDTLTAIRDRHNGLRASLRDAGAWDREKVRVRDDADAALAQLARYLRRRLLAFGLSEDELKGDRVLGRIQAVRDDLAASDDWVTGQKSPLDYFRHARRRGPVDRPWLRAGREELAAWGCSQEIITLLFVAVGLTSLPR